MEFRQVVDSLHRLSVYNCISQIVYHGSKWNIGRRYKHFEDNHKRMQQEGIIPKAQLPKLPKKRSYRSMASWKNKIGRSLTRGSIFGGEFEEYENDRIQERKCDLEKYVTALMAIEALVLQSRALRRFLEIPASTSFYRPAPVEVSDFKPFVAPNVIASSRSTGCVSEAEEKFAHFDQSNAEQFDKDVPALSTDTEDECLGSLSSEGEGSCSFTDDVNESCGSVPSVDTGVDTSTDLGATEDWHASEDSGNGYGACASKTSEGIDVSNWFRLTECAADKVSPGVTLISSAIVTFVLWCWRWHVAELCKLSPRGNPHHCSLLFFEIDMLCSYSTLVGIGRLYVGTVSSQTYMSG